MSDREKLRKLKEALRSAADWHPKGKTTESEFQQGYTRKVMAMELLKLIEETP